MCAGFTQGLRLVARTLQRRGVVSIAIEDPCHAPHRAAILSTGLKVIPIPVDQAGMRVERLPSTDAGAVLVTPAHQLAPSCIPARSGGLQAVFSTCQIPGYSVTNPAAFT